LEAFSIIAQTVFLARAITFLFQGEAVQSMLNETVYFGITFAVRHLLVRISQILVERFAEKTGSLLRKQLIEAYFTLGPRYVSYWLSAIFCAANPSRIIKIITIGIVTTKMI
ncbi:hypothetical protein ACT453_37815, partial [Bacillus sp. D-CC]